MGVYSNICVVVRQNSCRSGVARLWVVFAYPFHFGKSGFSAYFLRQIRISGFYPDFLCRSI